jgi:hypothetical protein
MIRVGGSPFEDEATAAGIGAPVKHRIGLDPDHCGSRAVAL